MVFVPAVEHKPKQRQTKVKTYFMPLCTWIICMVVAMATSMADQFFLAPLFDRTSKPNSISSCRLEFSKVPFVLSNFRGFVNNFLHGWESFYLPKQLSHYSKPFHSEFGTFHAELGQKFILQNFCKPNKPITNINELIRGALQVP